MTIERVERARAVMQERELDAILVSNPHSRRYLTGYTGDDHPPDETAGILLILRDRARMFASSNNVDWAQSEAPHIAVSAWGYPWTNTEAEAIAEEGAKNVGFEEEALSVGEFQRLTEAAGETVVWTPLAGVVERLRVIKDDVEIELLAEACRITDAAFAAGESALKAGMTEMELVAILDDAMRANGGDGPGFSTIVASGPHAARPHHAPGNRQIEPGEPVIIDMGAEYRGYRADLTRTICVGKPTSELISVYTTVLDAHEAVLAAIRSGVSGKDVDEVARALFRAAGHGDHFIHGLGHGVGLRIHEAPSAGPRSNDVLTSGMTLTVEPGLYIPGWGGVRIEDFVVIENNGYRNLTAAPKRLTFNQ
jgi:Xaa-Pro aminopeptidase